MSNIMNEQGHTKYPKIVYPQGNSVGFEHVGNGVTVNSEDEETEVMKGVVEEKKEPVKIAAGSPGWKPQA